MLVPALASTRPHAVTPTRPFAARFFNLDSPDVLGYKPFRRLCHGVTLSLTAAQDVGGASCSQSLIAPSVVDIQVVTATPNAQK
jgi:hypothetical protein